MKKIGLDFDGVIANTSAIKVLAAKEIFGKNLPETHTKRSAATESGILTDDEYTAIQKEIYKNFSWLKRTDPISNSINHIKNLRNRDIEIKIITSRYPESLEHVKSWLKNHGIEVPIVCVGYGTSKAKEANGLDLFVDDDLKKLNELVGMVANLYLFQQPHNKSDKPKPPITIVDNWEVLMEKILN